MHGPIACRMWVCVWIALLTWAQEVAAKPFVPEADNVVLERLPERVDPSLGELRRLRLGLARQPSNIELATRLARRAIGASRERGDPRFLGQAQAALAPWWNAADAPLEVLVLRATIRQSLHDFPGALADLDRVLRERPADAQARLTRSSVLSVIGRYAEASRDCDMLGPNVPQIVVVACRASPQSLTGEASRARRELDRALSMSSSLPRELAAWAHTLAAEIAMRDADASNAELHFRRALAADPRDAYLRGAYADFLIDTGRPRDAAALVGRETSNDVLLLRLALAEVRFENPTPDEQQQRRAHVAQLAERFAASRARGDVVHRREEARFALHLEHDPRKALALARSNWEVQREPADLRILAEAAEAADDAASKALVRTWQREHRLRDATLPAAARLAALALP